MTMRSHVLQAVSDQEGNLLANALVTVYDAAGVPFELPMYFGSEPAPVVDESGNAVIDGSGNPVTADQPLSNPYTAQDGVIDFWLDDPARLILSINPPGDSPAFNIIYDAMPPASELVLAASGLKIINTPLAGQVLLALDASTAQWVVPPAIVPAPPASPVEHPGAVQSLSVDTSVDPPLASWQLPTTGGPIDHITVLVSPTATPAAVSYQTSLAADAMSAPLPGLGTGEFSVRVTTIDANGTGWEVADCVFTVAASAPPQLIQNFAALPDTTGLTWTWTYPSDPATWTYMSMMLKDPDGIPFQSTQWPTSITPDSYQTLGDTFNISYGGILSPGTYTLQTWVYFTDGDGNQTLVDSMTKQVTV